MLKKEYDSEKIHEMIYKLGIHFIIPVRVYRQGKQNTWKMQRTDAS